MIHDSKRHHVESKYTAQDCSHTHAHTHTAGHSKEMTGNSWSFRLLVNNEARSDSVRELEQNISGDGRSGAANLSGTPTALSNMHQILRVRHVETKKKGPR